MNSKRLLKIVKKFYPKGLDFQEFENIEHPLRKNLKTACISALEDLRWVNFKNEIKSINIHFLEFSLLIQSEPSFIGSIIIENSDQCQLIIKISIIAPVYLVYFSRDDIDPRKRIIRLNTTNNYEDEILSKIKNLIKGIFIGYSEFEKDGFFTTVEDLGYLRIRFPRKPYLDECIFGTYMSVHPQ